MKILMLCKKFPYPMKDGESIAVSNLARELRALGCEITLLSLNTSKHYTDPQALPAEYDFFKRIETVDIDNAVHPWKALVSMLTGESYHVRRFRSDAFRAKLIALLQAEAFDIVQLETLYMAPYVETIRAHSNARIVMRAHNVEHEIWERITANTGSRLRKWYLAYLTRKLRQYEIDRFDAYDHLVTLTDRDLQLFREKGYANGASVAPIGFDLSAYAYAEPDFGPDMSIGFIGSLDWLPNQEGLDWFLASGWPDIRRRWPGITLHVAGRNAPDDLIHLHRPGVKVHGEVDDAAAFIRSHGIMIVPLLSGSGMRVKVVEGMALGRVVITTTLGLEGIDCTHGDQLFIADTPAQFAEAIAWCVEHPGEAVEMGRRAKAKARELYDSRSAAQAMLDIYHRLVGRPAVTGMHSRTPIPHG